MQNASLIKDMIEKAESLTAVYLYGLTAQAGASAGLRCASAPKTGPVIAPVAFSRGGGVAAAFSF